MVAFAAILGVILIICLGLILADAVAGSAYREEPGLHPLVWLMIGIIILLIGLSIYWMIEA